MECSEGVMEVPEGKRAEPSSSEDDLTWLVQTAHHFLSNIKPAGDSDGDDDRKDILSDADSLPLLVPNLIPKRAPSPLEVISGTNWKPSEVLAEPVVFVCGQRRRTQLAVVSFIGYQDESRRRRRHLSVMDSAISFPIRTSTKTQSFAYLFASSDSSDSSGVSTPTDHSHLASTSSASSSTTSSDHFTSTESETGSSDSESSRTSSSSTRPYDPYFLDDPELRTGKHKTVIALPGYLGSIGHFTRAEDLKKELNDQFRQIHPDIDPSLSLSKIRKLKMHLVKIAEQADLELSTVAKSFTFFEQLVLKDLVNKTNRKLVGAACLLLATKANDSKDVSIPGLLAAIFDHLEVGLHDLLAAEFPVFAALQFDLFPAQHEYLPHMERILTSLDYSNIQEYLGERMYNVWKSEV